VKAADWIALASAIIAATAAFVAISQARSARGAAVSARRQAIAAEEQVSISRSQLETEIQARDEAEGPTFIIEDAKRVMSSQHYVVATLMMSAGRPLWSVKARFRGSDVRWFVRQVDDMNQLPVLTWSHISSGARITVTAEMEWRAAPPVNLTLDLECLEESGKHRTWYRSYTISVNEIEVR